MRMNAGNFVMNYYYDDFQKQIVSVAFQLEKHELIIKVIF